MFMNEWIGTQVSQFIHEINWPATFNDQGEQQRRKFIYVIMDILAGEHVTEEQWNSLPEVAQKEQVSLVMTFAMSCERQTHTRNTQTPETIEVVESSRKGNNDYDMEMVNKVYNVLEQAFVTLNKERLRYFETNPKEEENENEHEDVFEMLNVLQDIHVSLHVVRSVWMQKDAQRDLALVLDE